MNKTETVIENKQVTASGEGDRGRKEIGEGD